MGETYLTVAEIAELLKLNQMTIRNWIDRGDLPALRAGPRRVRVRQSALDAFLKENERTAAKTGTVYNVSVSDGDTSLPALDGGERPEVWVYEVAAASADRAATIAVGRWRKELGRKAVAQSITVVRA